MHVVITGAARGIGEALAQRFAEQAPEATQLSLVDVDGDALQRVAGSLPAAAAPIVADLTDTSALPALVHAARERFGPIDVLVNNAGVMLVRPGDAFPERDAALTLDLNLLAPLRLIDAVVPEMVARGSGTIVNVASLAGLVPLHGCSYYGATKAGIAMASEVLHGELAEHGVHVVTVYPGPVATELERGARASLERSTVAELAPLGDRHVLAARIQRAVERRRARVVYPRSYALARYFPTAAAWLTRRLSPKAQRIQPEEKAQRSAL